MSKRHTWRRPVRVVCATLALFTLAVAGLASPAQASGHTSSVVAPINTTYVDLGSFGPPLPPDYDDPFGNAVLLWNRSGADVSPRLWGGMSLVNAPNFCARISVRYWDGNNLLDRENTQSVCAQNGNLQFLQIVDFGTFTGQVTHVGIAAMLQFSGQNWVQQMSATVYP